MGSHKPPQYCCEAFGLACLFEEPAAGDPSSWPVCRQESHSGWAECFDAANIEVEFWELRCIACEFPVCYMQSTHHARDVGTQQIKDVDPYIAAASLRVSAQLLHAP